MQLTHDVVELDILPLLTRYIQEEGLGPGDRLPPLRELSERWHLKVQAIRDGLVQARRLGLVEIRPQSGMFVGAPEFATVLTALEDALSLVVLSSDENLMDLVEARRALEMETVTRAAERCEIKHLPPLRDALEKMEKAPNRTAYVEADNAFHLQIAMIAGNGVQVTVLRSFLTLLTPFRKRMCVMPRVRESANGSHTDLYESLLKGDIEAARTAMAKQFDYDPHTLVDLLASRKMVARAKPEERAREFH